MLPHVGLFLLNALAIAVGVSTLPLRDTDVPAVWLSIAWASIYVLVLGRIIAEAVIAPQVIKQRLERRTAGAMLSRALPWPTRWAESDELISSAMADAAETPPTS
ncbi:hypothetical protein [Paractinoplanes durhamensis]|uniref:hypothetical protein n=1 Tax=Paractinoplanes durhamensis TaxID=113563 RepID=UPI001EF33C2B|nr:hypothetical protein [Actinoplanes durhamensis]